MEDSQIGSLIIGLLTGLGMYVAGLILKKKPPGMINSIYGYRTKRSVKNQLLWDDIDSYHTFNNKD